VSAQGLYEQHLEDALRDLLHWHRNGNRLTKQDALQKLNKTVSDMIEKIQKGE
jgi:Ran GTPase-activating protein (RanGAP) involved in mRNA processing and transport